MQTGIILDHIAFSEQSYLIIKEVNRYCETSINDVCIFVDNISSRIMEPSCAVVDTGEIPTVVNGVLIALDISTAESLLKACTPAKKVLYLWDCNWIYNTVDFSKLYEMLSGKKITVILRSNDHKKILINLGIEVNEVLEQFNIGDLHAICRTE